MDFFNPTYNLRIQMGIPSTPQRFKDKGRIQSFFSGKKCLCLPSPIMRYTRGWFGGASLLSITSESSDKKGIYKIAVSDQTRFIFEYKQKLLDGVKEVIDSSKDIENDLLIDDKHMLGRGVSAEVFLGKLKNKTTGEYQEVAVKQYNFKNLLTIFDDTSMNGTNELEFIKEINSLLKLQNEKHITTMLGLISRDNVYSIILECADMDFVAYQSLLISHNIFEEKSALNGSHLANIVEQILSGVTECVRNGVQHTDIGPHNILIFHGENKIKITDYGRVNLNCNKDIAQKNMMRYFADFFIYVCVANALPDVEYSNLENTSEILFDVLASLPREKRRDIAVIKSKYIDKISHLVYSHEPLKSVLGLTFPYKDLNVKCTFEDTPQSIIESVRADKNKPQPLPDLRVVPLIC